MSHQHFLDPSTHPAVKRAIEDKQYKQVGGVGLVAAVLICVAAGVNAIGIWSDWHRYRVARDFVAGDRGLTVDDLTSADNISDATGWAGVIALFVAGVVFLVWLWRARQNAEILCMARHRRGLGWVVGSWICPVVNLWFPYMIVDDVYRASRPNNDRDLLDLRTVPGSSRLNTWWGLYLGSTTATWIAVSVLRRDVTVDSLRLIAVVDTLQAALMFGAAALLIMIMKEISAWQTPRWPS